MALCLLCAPKRWQVHDLNRRIPSTWIDHRTPVDDIEPELSSHDAYQEASRRFARILNRSFQHIGAAIERSRGPELRQVQTAYWQVCFALGLSVCDPTNMTERARMLGIRKATISKGATMFCRANFLPPSFHMKKEESYDAYRRARIDAIKRCNSRPLFKKV